jgi:predicted RNA-binding Zn ribbon-like protein
MLAMENAHPNPPGAALFLADDIALDFINTHYGKGSGEVECLQSDQNVLDWLARAGLANELQEVPHIGKGGTLVQAAHQLRDAARDAVERRKAGSSADVELLNRVLASAPSYEQIKWKRGQAPVLQRFRKATSSAAVLAPVASAIAKLLVEDDFDLVRQCEGDICTLWFYDRTKSHRRRWCDMALCGNRAKVAAFRERNKSG